MTIRFLLNWASAIITGGRFDEAREMFEKAIEFNPGAYESYLEFGDIITSVRMYLEAEALFQKIPGIESG